MNRSAFILSTLIFLPSLLGLFNLLSPPRKGREGFHIPFISSCLSLALTFIIWHKFDGNNPGMQFVENCQWIPQLGINYVLGLDSISLLMIFLTSIVSFLTFVHASGETNTIAHSRIYYSLFLFLQTGLYGTFLANNLFLFYFFWEVALIPMLFIVGIWGGPNRLKITLKFFIYTLAGSLLMLLAIIYIIKHGGILPSFDGSSFGHALASPPFWLFLAFTIAFLIKIPAVPFHTWQPDIYSEAPLMGAIFLSAAMAKMGTYGLLRYSLGLFPQVAQYMAPCMWTLAIIAIVYGAFCAWRQSNFKRLIAYSSISHSGFIVLGLFTLNTVGVTGALYQMLNHGLLVLGLFLIASYLFERFGTDTFTQLGGCAKLVPKLSIAFFILILSSVALPGTNSFVGEFAILTGLFKANPLATVFAGLGIILGAVYALRLFQLSMLGAAKNGFQAASYSDLRPKELFIMVILAFFILGIGICPDLFLAKTKLSILGLLAPLG